MLILELIERLQSVVKSSHKNDINSYLTLFVQIQIKEQIQEQVQEPQLLLTYQKEKKNKVVHKLKKRRI